MPKKTRILVVEDDPAILEGLLDILVFHGHEPVGIEDGGKGLETALQGGFDMVMLDVMLPTMDGFSICREVRAAFPKLGILMLTAKGGEEDVITGFKAGADDYVTKPFSIKELLVRVEALLRRTGMAVADHAVEIGGITFDGGTLKAQCGDVCLDFTRREMDIVLYLHEHDERIVSKRELLSEVWQYPDPDVETRTVDIHMAKLRKKIGSLCGCEPSDGFVKTIRGEGYRIVLP